MNKRELKQLIQECIAEIAGNVPPRETIAAMKLEAEELVKTIADKSAEDEGTCVRGAGIAVWGGTRGVILTHAPYQGNVGSYNYLLPVLKEMKKRYPQYQIYWEDGAMD